MADYDSILNVEEFIADHYFTADETKGENFGKRVAARTKEWKNEEAAGPFERLKSRRAELEKLFAYVGSGDSSTVRSVLRADGTEIETAYPTSGFPMKNGTEDVNAALLQVFGFDSPQPFSMYTAALKFIEFPVIRHGDAWALSLPEAASPEELIEKRLTIRRCRTNSAGEVIEKIHQDISAQDLVSEIFLSQDPPEFLVVFAGNWAVLARRESWPLGRFIAVNVALAVERAEVKNKGELQRATCILARVNVAKAADGSRWWQETLDESLAHAADVSDELRAAVRESIEIIGGDVVDRLRAEGVDPADIDAEELGRQALRYLYRILFVLFAETRPELEILPVGTPEYDEGYGLGRLRELVLNPPNTERGGTGTHLYQSLNLLFELIDSGHEGGGQGLTFRSLKADLFQPEATVMIARAGLSNEALHRVLENLLLTRESRGHDRGFISYATLGVSQLGQVYEGLMSFRGFIAPEDLVEVAPKGDASKGSWLVSVDKADDLPADSVVMTQVVDSAGGTHTEVRRHPSGTFVFRQSSRDRERSASFYSPQVITEFVVSQAIEVLREEGRVKTAADVLDLAVCEPAMGSGAFAVEAVSQLAALYLELYQEETSEQIDPGEYAAVLQRVKAHIALHQVYGVDLNATAVELGEISLWLDTMTSDLKAPWFGLHLRRGNSLIGATRSTYSAEQVADKRYLKGVPTHAPLSNLAEALSTTGYDAKVLDRIHHFLLPASGWGAACEAKDLKSFAADEQKQMKAWRSRTQRKLTKTQIKKLQDLAASVERLWGYALTRMRIAEDQARRDIDFPGHITEHTAKNVSREQIESDLLHNENGSYGRLRAVMDAWNALWFWPLDKVDELPEIDEWIAGLQALLGEARRAKPSERAQFEIGQDPSWEEISVAEEFYLRFNMARSLDRAHAEHPWLVTAREVASEQGFFHWELDFAAVFARGGFDFQVGNPPWVRPTINLDELLAESDPWFKLAHKPTQEAKKQRRAAVLAGPAARSIVQQGITETVATAEVLGDSVRYPFLVKQQPDLYRGFMEQTWRHVAPSGVVGLVHPESHFTEKKAASLRKAAYLRLRRHWQFINELSLYDVHHLVSYGVHIYANAQSAPGFLSATSLYHPSTVTDSLVHDGSGAAPGIKDDENHWDLRPHADRIITVDDAELEVWHSILEDPDTPLYETRMVYTVNRDAARVLAKLAEAPRIRELGLQFSAGWHESGDRQNGYFESEWGYPESWDDAILQGPHLGVALPMQKQPNETMKHNQDWVEIDLEALPEDFIPATAYKPLREELAAAGEGRDYDEDYGYWVTSDGDRIRVADTYRIAWRAMAATTGFRTFYPSVIPPGARHIHGIHTAGPIGDEDGVLAGAFAATILNDFLIRSIGLSNLYGPSFENLVCSARGHAKCLLVKEFLRLNGLTSAYASIWGSATGLHWDSSVPYRMAEDRRLAQIRIDVAAAIALGITADDLCTIYRTQFPVMRRYDQENRYDANGRLVPGEVMKLQKKRGDDEVLSEAERTWTHPQSGVEYTFEYPFRQLDREADMRAAYARLEAELAQCDVDN